MYIGNMYVVMGVLAETLRDGIECYGDYIPDDNIATLHRGLYYGSKDGEDYDITKDGEDSFSLLKKACAELKIGIEIEDSGKSFELTFQVPGSLINGTEVIDIVALTTAVKKQIKTKSFM